MVREAPVYDRFAASLHWLTAALVIGLIVLGLAAEAMQKAFGISEFTTLTLHKSLGITVFALTLLRLVWWFGHRPPPLPEIPEWQRLIAHAVHAAFYAFMIVMPVLGYLLSSGGPYPLGWFGVPLPKAPVTKPVADVAHVAHVAGGIAMTILVAGHIGAALWHQFARHDRLIARMRIGQAFSAVAPKAPGCSTE